MSIIYFSFSSRRCSHILKTCGAHFCRFSRLWHYSSVISHLRLSHTLWASLSSVNTLVCHLMPIACHLVLKRMKRYSSSTNTFAVHYYFIHCLSLSDDTISLHDRRFAVILFMISCVSHIFFLLFYEFFPIVFHCFKHSSSYFMDTSFHKWRRNAIVWFFPFTIFLAGAHCQWTLSKGRLYSR